MKIIGACNFALAIKGSIRSKSASILVASELQLLTFSPSSSSQVIRKSKSSYCKAVAIFCWKSVYCKDARSGGNRILLILSSLLALTTRGTPGGSDRLNPVIEGCDGGITPMNDVKASCFPLFLFQSTFWWSQEDRD
jgi:hypothetical protein